MRRRTFDVLMSVGGLMLTILLLVAGTLMVGWQFAEDKVHDRLAAAPLFPTTEEAYLKVGIEIEGVFLVIVGVIFVAAGYFLTRFAGGISR